MAEYNSNTSEKTNNENYSLKTTNSTELNSPEFGGLGRTVDSTQLNSQSFRELDRTVDSIQLNSQLSREFGRIEDYIELNIYNTDDNLITHIRDFRDFSFSAEGINPSTGLSTEIVLDPSKVLNDLKFNAGEFKLEYRFQRKKIFNSFQKIFYIKEISNSRNEIRILSNELSNLQLEQRYKLFEQEIQESEYLKDFTLNFGNGNNILAINIALDKSGKNYSLLIKLFEPLPSNLSVNSTFRIVEDLIQPVIYNSNIDSPIVEDNTISILGPNYKVNTRLNSSVPSEFKTYDELLNGGISSSYQNLTNALSSSLEPSVNYTNLNTDSGYHFENFTHFGSATEKLNNFKYKLKLIELYNSQITSINTITGDASTSLPVLGNKQNIENKINKVIGGFDGYERFLYFESGTYSWPKSNSNKPYSQHLITSTEALTWLGSNLSNNSYYGGQLFSSSRFDNQNIYNLEKIIPEYIKNNEDNDYYKLFVNMIGQHFDQSWLYIKSLTENKKAENHLNKGIDKDLVYNTLKSLGIKVFDEFENVNLFEYITGINKDGSLFHPTGSGETLISSSNAGSLPKSDITKEKWKRIYHNLPYLLKTKGTKRGIRALITSYGIPSTILNIKEFGGSTTDSTKYKTFSHDKSSYVLKGDSGTDGYFIKTPWSSSLTDALSPSAKTVEFRIKPHRSNESYHLWSLSGSTGVNSNSDEDQNLILEPYTNNDILSSGDADQYGRLKWYTNHNNSFKTTEYFPIYNGDFWNIVIGIDAIGKSQGQFPNKTIFGAYQANYNKNIHAYTQSFSSFNVNQHTKAWGVNNDGAYNHQAGANYCYIGGIPPGSVNTDISNLRYSGSIQEVKYHFGELLSHETLKKHALEPSMYSGNTISSSYENVVLRLPLGGNLHKTSQSFHPNYSVDYLGDITSNMTTQVWESITETHHLITPDTVGKSMTSEKVRIDTGEVKDNILSRDIKSETSTLDRQPLDTNDLGIYFSPSFEMNKDIIYHLGSFRLDDYIGDPTHISENLYPDLKTLSDKYFKKNVNRYNYTDFIHSIKQFDHTLFKMIESMVPAKSNLKTGIIIEPHYLERSKVGLQANLPSVTQHTYDAVLDLDSNSDTSNSSVSAEYLSIEANYNLDENNLNFDNTIEPLLHNVASGRISKKYYTEVK